MSRTTTLIAALFCATCFACGDEKEDEHGHDNSDGHHDNENKSVTAMFAPKSGNTTLAGTAVFSGEKGKVSVKVDLTGAPPGQHGLHIHTTGDCSDDAAMNAGGHWNPSEQMHGSPGATSHLGDIGNITVAADGTASHTATNPLWEIGTGTPNDVTNKAVIVHEKADDLMTQPTGDAGGRIGCGVIK